MFTYRLLNPDGTPADKPTFKSSEPDRHVGDKVLILPGTGTASSGCRSRPPT